MGCEQVAEFRSCLFVGFDRALVLATDVTDRVAVTGNLAFGLQTRLLANEIGLFVRRSLRLVGGALREHERILQRFFHGFEVADALFEIRNFGFERGLMLRAVLERFDDFIQKCVDFGAVVALQRLFETLVLDIDRADLLHFSLGRKRSRGYRRPSSIREVRLRLPRCPTERSDRSPRPTFASYRRWYMQRPR